MLATNEWGYPLRQGQRINVSFFSRSQTLFFGGREKATTGTHVCCSQPIDVSPRETSAKRRGGSRNSCFRRLPWDRLKLNTFYFWLRQQLLQAQSSSRSISCFFRFLVCFNRSWHVHSNPAPSTASCISFLGISLTLESNSVRYTCIHGHWSPPDRCQGRTWYAHHACGVTTATESYFLPPSQQFLSYYELSLS